MKILRVNWCRRTLVAAQALFWTVITAVLLGITGCSTNEMKGTPFFSGDFAKTKGPAEQRVNLWPLCYYRDPALSVLWPVFEFTDDHSAVRPLFTVYDLDKTKREYNVLWPLAQFDQTSGNNRIFPAFWSSNHTVVFPLYWHFKEPYGTRGGIDSLFPLYIYANNGSNRYNFHAAFPIVHVARNGQRAGWHVWPIAGSYTNPHGFYQFEAWPLAHQWSDHDGTENGHTVLPLYLSQTDKNGSEFYSLPWMSRTENDGTYWRFAPPLYGSYSNATTSATATPIWAHGRSGSNEWNAIIPLCYWSPQEKFFISPVTGWQRGSNSFFYPLTPLAGVRNGETKGSWFIPFYYHSENTKSGKAFDNWLLLGGRSKDKTHSESWFIPFYHYENFGSLDSQPESPVCYGKFGTEWRFLQFLVAYDNVCRINPAPKKKDALPAAATNTPPVREYSRKFSAFPLWKQSTLSRPDSGTTNVQSSALIFVFDYKHDLKSAQPGPSVSDYTRARLLWRLWHYEKGDGDVSVDIFPAITYDRKMDGFSRTAFLGRLYRYEHTRTETKVDLLFIPILRSHRGK